MKTEVKIDSFAGQEIQKIDPSIREKGYYPAIASRLILRSFIRQLFANQPVGKFKWINDPENTEIHIVDFGGRESVGQTKPIIAIQRSVVNANFTSPKSITLTGAKLTTTMQTHSIVIPIVVHCVSKEDLEAETLASFIFHGILSFQESLMSLGIRGVRNLSLGVPMPADGFFVGSKVEAFTCPVSMMMVIDMTWLRTIMDKKDVLEFMERNGVDPTSMNIPPQTFENVSVWRI
jgi:hypothetical protein